MSASLPLESHVLPEPVYSAGSTVSVPVSGAAAFLYTPGGPPPGSQARAWVEAAAPHVHQPAVGVVQHVTSEYPRGGPSDAFLPDAVAAAPPASAWPVQQALFTNAQHPPVLQRTGPTYRSDAGSGLAPGVFFTNPATMVNPAVTQAYASAAGHVVQASAPCRASPAFVDFCHGAQNAQRDDASGRVDYVGVQDALTTLAGPHEPSRVYVLYSTGDPGHSTPVVTSPGVAAPYYAPGPSAGTSQVFHVDVVHGDPAFQLMECAVRVPCTPARGTLPGTMPVQRPTAAHSSADGYGAAYSLDGAAAAAPRYTLAPARAQDIHAEAMPALPAFVRLPVQPVPGTQSLHGLQSVVPSYTDGGGYGVPNHVQHAPLAPGVLAPRCGSVAFGTRGGRGRVGGGRAGGRKMVAPKPHGMGQQSPVPSPWVFVRGIAPWVTREALIRSFERFGDLVSVHTFNSARGRSTQKWISRNFAFLQFYNSVQASAAVHWMHGSTDCELTMRPEGLELSFAPEPHKT